MSTIDELIDRQQAAFGSIKQLLTNYKKDSAQRKTTEYLQKRIDALESHWSEFEQNHILIVQQGEKDIQYFNDDVYNKTREIYKATLNDMIRACEEKAATFSTPTPTGASGAGASGAGASGAGATEVRSLYGAEENPKNNYPHQLLQQQQCQFMAFHRAVSKINLETMNEKWDLEDNLSTIKTRWEAIDKLHWQIKLKGSDSNYEEQYYSCEDTYDKVRKELSKKIWANIHYEKSTPTIKLSEFNGNYNQWLPFRDLFIELIHSNPLLPKAQKISHLKSKLKGEAEKLVQHLAPNADNYDSCWEILIQRYDNPRLLFTSFANTLLNQPALQQQNAYGLKKLHDVTLESLNGLGNIGLNVSTWGPLIVHILLQKLDPATYNDYIQHLDSPRSLPELDGFLKFLESRFMAMETIKTRNGATTKPTNQNNIQKNYNGQKATNYNKSDRLPHTYHASVKICPLCKNTTHVLMHCRKFINMSVDERNDTVTKNQLCKNCLYSHGEQTCASTKRCLTCNNAHHTLLHQKKNTTPSMSHQAYRSSQESYGPLNRSTNHVRDDEREVLLTTALLMVQNQAGEYITLRALLDQGSQVSLITEEAAQRLRLQRKRMSATVSGVGVSMGNCKGLLSLNCKSLNTDYTFSVQALIMNKLIRNLPNATFKKSSWSHLETLKLADPEFNVSNPVDLLLGADVYSDIILDGLLKGETNTPVAQQTKLGWILCGNVKTFNCLVTLNELEDLSRFWETEEISNNNNSDLPTEDYCEKFYNETTTRKSDGRYVVKMPMKENYEKQLGISKNRAVSQFYQQERKMDRSNKLSQMYREFIAEYEYLGHMKPAPTSSNDRLSVYLPHHGVLRESSTTTKLRVVYNASMKTSTGLSLNDVMEKGPNLQKDLQTLLIKFRCYRYTLTADVEKMFRQILIHEDQQHLQKIVWRENREQPLQDMVLRTVTYGTKSAPYLAMRTLKQLALDEGANYPDAAEKLINECYMDDVITGAPTIEEAKQLQLDLSALLKKGGFHLRKWSSNDSRVLKNIPTEDCSTNSCLDFNQEESTKTLGISYNKKTDSFIFNWKLPAPKGEITKRILLSDISKLYDPLGWLAPIVVKAKLLFQKVWLSNIGWEQRLPNDIEIEWQNIRKDLPNVNQISIPRWLHNGNTIEILGYCDSSEKAYSCVVYSRTANSDGTYITHLIGAKTRVAPLNKKTSLPRLELAGAVLLSKFIDKIKSSLCGYELHIACWTDSKVVLAWIQGDVTRWEKYVANRVKQITPIVNAKQWRYVKTEDNPADCATRGLLPSQAASFELWWNGPKWLKTTKIEHENKTSQTFITTSTVQCINNNSSAPKNADTKSVADYLLDRHSSLSRLARVTAWILRFTTAVRCKQTTHGVVLSSEELNRAMTYIIQQVQRENYCEEIENLKKRGTVNNKSSLLKLKPYLDEDGLLRVGGRLQHSSLPEETKHPVILPHRGKLTHLIIEDCHKKTIHGGARLTLAQVRAKFWVTGGNRAVKNVIRQCVKCHRHRSRTNEQLMGDLPEERVTPSRPFSHMGIDFTGSMEIKINKGRGVKTSKGYIAIFICMVTKAVHIELVSDLTTQTFLAAFQRVCARRGCPKHVYTDNGTNFVGAGRVLQEEFEQMATLTSPELQDVINELHISWHYNAPLWPTGAGLWEAAVKSMKYHLRRVLGEQKLTYEEFSTLLTQIEGCMNSRPLSPLTEDPQDLDYLTPGHFLTGGPILSLPREDHKDLRQVELRERWKLVEHMLQHIWHRWSSEYLHQLQERSKWNEAKKNIEVDDLVLIKDENLPPGRWALGRVQETHTGRDGYVRVVTLKTKNGTLKRPILKLSPLPIITTSIPGDAKENIQKDEKQRTEQLTQTQKKEKKKTTLNCYFTIMMMILASIGNVKSAKIEEGYEMTPFKTEHPLYFDDIGKVQYVHDEWRLLVYYNLTTYWEGAKKVQEYVNHIAYICTKDTENQVCGPLIAQLRHELEQFTEYNSLLMSHHENRKKRGYFNGVGSLARTLFGTLDEDFADKYQQDIENVKKNEDYLLDLVKNQTIIVEAENKVLKKNEEFMKGQFKAINNFTREVNFTLTSVKSTLLSVMLMNDVNAAALTSNLLIDNLRRTQEILMNALTNVYKGHLDNHLLTPSQLANQLNFIATKTPARLTLPIKNIQHELKKLYKLLYVKARITTNYLLYEIHIPLTSDEDFTAYRIISLPIRRNGRTTMVKTQSPLIAINFRKNTYVSMEEEDLQECTMMEEDIFICTTMHPIYNLHNENAPCEAIIFSQRESLPCETTTITCRNSWIKLHKQNTWLYSCCDVCTLRFICGDQLTSNTTSGTGSIVMTQECTVQRKESTIYSQNYFGSQMKTGPDMDIPHLLTSSVNVMANRSFPNLHLQAGRKEASEEYTEIEKQIHYQRDHEKLPEPIRSHDIHQYTVMYLLVAAALVSMLVYCIKRHRPAARPTPSQPMDQRIQSIEMGVIDKNKDRQQPARSSSRKSRKYFDFNDV